jgi:hypothetical protein
MASMFGKQRGVALVVSLILLLVVTVAALSAVRYSSLELFIARNDEYRLSSYQAVQSLVEATIAGGIPATGNDGVVSCSSTSITASSLGDCSGATTVTLPTTIAPSADLSGGDAAPIKVVVRQVAHDQPTGRRIAGNGNKVRGGRWVVTGSYNHNDTGAGSTLVNQGWYDEYAIGEEVTSGTTD